jgi:hypothetical protein
MPAKNSKAGIMAALLLLYGIKEKKIASCQILEVKWTGFARKYFKPHCSAGITSLLFSAAGSTMPW